MLDEHHLSQDVCKGSEKIIIPNWNPIKALTWLAARAESLEQQVRFRFFQDTKGFYNFMPIEKALTNYKDNPPFEFVYRGNASGDKDFFAIKNLVFNPASYDLGKALREGYLKGRAFDINISKKTLGVVDYDYFKIFDNIICIV